MTSPKTPSPNQDAQGASSILIDLVFNLALPVLILEKLSHRMGENGPLWALILALSFPLGFGLYDYVKKKKRNWAAVLGFVNTLFTGAFALFGLTRNWYIVKELLIPLILGIYVLLSTKSQKPLVEQLVYNDKVLNTSLIEERLKSIGRFSDLTQHLRLSTLLFAASFFLSALLNFLVANKVFTDIEYFWNASERAAIRNLQIAEMTKLGYVIIALPCMVITMVIVWYLLYGVTKLTGLTMNEIMVTKGEKS